MARSRRSGRGGGTGRQIGIIVVLITAIVVLGGGLIWLLVKAKTEYVARDVATLCPLTGPVSQTIVLLDTTDPLAAVTQTQLLNKLHDVEAAIPKDGYFELRLLNADPAKSSPVVNLCNPGDGSDIDPLTGNPGKARERWRTEYVGRVEAALADAVTGTEQDYSPIMEAIQLIAADRLTSAKDRALPNRLIVVSDMIQHTETYSHYRNGLSMEAYNSGPAARLATDLARAEVEFWMVRRATTRFSLDELGAFWTQWAEANNARPPAKITPLMGLD